VIILEDDLMSSSHEKLPMIFWVQIALVLIVGAIYLMTPAAPKHHGAEAAGHEVSAETKTALEPVGEVAIKEAGSVDGASRNGESIVKKTCAACHIAGVANAPKLDASAKDAWATRMTAEKGLDGLVASAKKGKNGMPPNGADPSLSDDELKAAIVHMLGQVGIEVVAEENTPAKAEDGINTAKVVDAAVEAKKDESIEKPAVTTALASAPTKEKATDKSAAISAAAIAVEEKPVATTEEVKEPSSPVEPTVPVAPKAETVTAPAAPKAAIMPTAEVPAAPAAPKVEESQLAPVETTSAPKIAAPTEKVPAAPVAPKVEESQSAPVEVTSKPTTEAPTAPKAEENQPAAVETPPVPEVVEPTTEESKPASEPAVPTAKEASATPAVEETKSVTPTADAAAAVDLVAGEKTYKSICFSCHDLGVSNAPKPGDKAAWAARIAKGMDALYNTALKGDSKMPGMPAKGGNPTLSDSDVKNAVSYMVELSK
jgi:cytochrome c5